MINTIKKEIINLISSNVSEVQDLRDFNALNFRGMPAISVTFSDNENDFVTTSENRRIFTFKIRCFVLAGAASQPITDDKAQRVERVMGDLVWSVINALDADITLGGNVEWTDAAPSVWNYVDLQNGSCLMAEILLRVHKDRTVV